MRNLYFILLVILSVVHAASASVTVAVGKKELVYSKSVRLIDVLKQYPNLDSVYWPAASIFQYSDLELNRKRQNVIFELNKKVKEYQINSPELSESMRGLIKSITDWKLAKRLSTTIDYDLARIKQKHNPLITSGKYLLKLESRPQSIEIFGSTQKTRTLDHLAHSDISAYFKNLKLTALSNKDYALIIQADGRVIKSPVAYWNKSHQEVMPGSFIFIPFKSSLLSPDFDEINQTIIELAKNRVN